MAIDGYCMLSKILQKFETCYSMSGLSVCSTSSPASREQNVRKAA